MSEKLPQDHYKVTPKKQEDSKASSEGEITGVTNISRAVVPKSIQKTVFLKMNEQERTSKGLMIGLKRIFQHNTLSRNRKQL